MPGGSVGTCAVYGSRDRPSPPPSSPSNELPYVLLRSDAQKLRWLTRCHATHVSWLRSALHSAARLELLVDASSLPSAASVATARSQLQSKLDVPAFVYTVEEIHAAFPAVRHWPSPQDHDASGKATPPSTSRPPT